MADVTTPPDITGPVDFGGNDHITVGSGSKIESSTSRVLNQTTAATGVLIDNSGQIVSTNASGRGIDFGVGTAMTFTLDNNDGAAIRSAGDALRINVNITSGTVVVNNAGTIETTGTGDNNGQAIDFASIKGGTASVTINNLAGGLIQTADADAVRAGNSTVNNAGQIIAHDFEDNTGADGVDFQDSAAGAVVNSGTISGGRHGITISLGSNNTTASIVNVLNKANGEIIGRNGSGVGSDVSGVVVNHGLISGRVDDRSGVPDGDGDGVDIDYIGTITNYGTIEGAGAKGSKDGLPNTSEAIAMGGGTIRNRAGGIIRGVDNGVLVDDSNQGAAFGAVVIANDGTIEGTSGYGIRIVSELDNKITNRGTITGGNGQAIVFGDGNDKLVTGAGSVINGSVDGGGGDDALAGDSGDNALIGGSGNDTLDGGAGADTMTGGLGNDWFHVDNTGDVVVELADEGIDTVFTSIDYTLGADVERLRAVADAGLALGGNDLANTLIGGAGNDTLDGGLGRDTLSGGDGRDTFVFDSALGPDNIDRIKDFSAADDTVALSQAIFTGLSLGALGADAFVIGTQAETADTRIIYNNTNGALFYDADGSGSGAATFFARVAPNLALTSDNFTVVA